MRSSDLLQVVPSGLLQVDVCRLDATCFINLHQVCMQMSTCGKPDFNRLAAS
jgi:hypothetical protein